MKRGAYTHMQLEKCFQCTDNVTHTGRSYYRKQYIQHFFRNAVMILRRDNCGVAPLKKDGIMFTQNETKADILNQQFASVFSHEDTSALPDMGPSPYPDMPDITVNNPGIAKLLSGLNPHKACGPDQIPPRLLKEFADEIAPSLGLLFNASLHQHKVGLPTEWKKALVVPLFKKGERAKPAKYTPVSHTCICCKILENVVHHHIITHLGKLNILSEAQHGFRKDRSCESQLILTIQDLASGLEEGG